MTCTKRHVACITFHDFSRLRSLALSLPHPRKRTMDTPTQGGNTVNTSNGPFGAFGTYFFFWVSLLSTDDLTTRKGAGMMGHTPDRNSNRTQGGNARQRPKDEDEALMRDLEQKEKSLNAVFLSVREPFHHLSPRALRG